MSDDRLYTAEENALVCTSLDGTEIFRTETGLDPSTLAVSENLVLAVGGRGADGAIQVFDKDGTLRQTIETRGRPWKVVFDDSARRFACSFSIGFVSVHSSEDDCNEIIQWYIDDSSRIVALMWLKDNEICTGSYSGRIAIWDVETGNQLRELQSAHALGISRMTQMANTSNILIAGHNYGVVRIWSLRDGSHQEIKPQNDWIYAIVLSEDHNLVVTCSDDQQVVGFDIDSFEIRWQLSVEAIPTSLALHNDEVFVGMFKEAVVVLDIKDGTRRRVFPRKSIGRVYIAVCQNSLLQHGFQFAE